MRFDLSLIPTATLFVMMLSMGMTLAVADFARLVRRPSAFALGAVGQLLVLPLVAYGIAGALDLSSTNAVGLMLIAACPGGVASNLLTYMARGDTALSISLTAFSSGVAFITVPIVLGLGLRGFGGSGAVIELPAAETALTVFVTTALPVALGIALRRLRPSTAARWHRPLLILSSSVLLLLVVGLAGSLFASGEDFGGLFLRATPAVVLLITVMTGLAVFGARALGLRGEHGRTIAIELGMQNFNLALVIALTILEQQRYAGVAIVYLPVMFLFASGLVLRGRRSQSGAATRLPN